MSKNEGFFNNFKNPQTFCRGRTHSNLCVTLVLNSARQDLGSNVAQ